LLLLVTITCLLGGVGGGGCNPGRKWGEFDSENDAERYILEELLERFYRGIKNHPNIKSKVSRAIKAMEKRVSELKTGKQMVMF
jgi:hypothetical protein